jgi:hypothetical protein
MNQPAPTPTPRTDAATYPADCLGKTLVTNRDCSRALETELVTLTAAYTCTHHTDQKRAACPVCLVAALTAELEDPQKLHAHCLRTLNEGQIAHLFGERMTEIINRAERAEAELATERARLDAGTILLTVAGERVWHCGVDLRAAIDAAMKEGAK